MVGQLAFQVLHEQVEGASDELLKLLLQDVQKNKKFSWEYISFGARCLQFIYPSPKIVRLLTETSVKYVIEDVQKRESPRRFEETRGLIGALLSAAPESRPTVADSLQSEIIKYSKNPDDKLSLRAIDLGLSLRFPLRRYSTERDMNECWESVENKIFAQMDEKLQNLAPNDFLAFMHYFYRHDMPIEKLFEWYTPDHLFFEGRYIILGRFYMSIAYYFNRHLPMFGIPVKQEISLELTKALKSAGELGKILLSKPLPCFSYAIVNRALRFIPPLDYLLEPRNYGQPESIKGPQIKVPISGDAIIGFWCLWSAIAETVENQKELISQLKKSQSPAIKAISDTIEARMHTITPDEALQNLKKFNPPHDTLHFVERWISREISFVHPPKPEDLKKGK